MPVSLPARLVVFATSNWFGAPRLPGGFKRAGFEVAVIAPTDNPMLLTRHADMRCELKQGARAGHIRALLAQLAGDWQAHSVIPADEAAIELLYRFAQTIVSDDEAPLAEMLRRSLPPVEYLETLRSKHRTKQLACAAGLLAPAQAVTGTVDDALDFAAHNGYPVMLKPEQGAAGSGVVRCDDAAVLREQYARLATAKLVAGPRLLIESYVAGLEADYPFVAVNGEVLTGLSKLKRRTHPGPFSPSSVVELADLPAVAEAARRLAAACRYNGFGSVQFQLDAKGVAHFIEFNTRPIPMMHMDEAMVGIDWCRSWHAAMQGSPQPVFSGVQLGRKIALFPQELLRDRHSAFLTTDAIHDVPWDDPELLRSYLAPPSKSSAA